MTHPADPGTAVPRMLHLLTAHWTAATVQAAVRLGVFDAVGDEPVAVRELATELDADADALDRLLRALTGLGLMERADAGHYRHSPLSNLLRSGNRPGLAPLARYTTLPQVWEPWPRLADAVRTGRPVFSQVYGKDFYAHLSEDAPEAGAMFNEAMTANTRLVVAEAAQALDLSGAATVADIGGGQGLMLAELLRHNPAVTGVLLDLASVVEGALPELVQGGGLAARCRVVPGDCQEAVPVAADVYVLKHILHNRDDGACVRVLRNVARSAPSGARVVVIERLIGSGGPFERQHTIMDMFMLLMLGGRERDEPEFAALFERAGLSPAGTVPVAGGQVALIEARVP
jgi:C-methyltransferase